MIVLPGGFRRARAVTPGMGGGAALAGFMRHAADA